MIPVRCREAYNTHTYTHTYTQHRLFATTTTNNSNDNDEATVICQPSSHYNGVGMDRQHRAFVATVRNDNDNDSTNDDDGGR